MTTNFFQTTSNRVELTDEQEVAEILTDYEFPSETNELVENGVIQICTGDIPGGGFDVFDSPDRDVDRNETDQSAKDELYERIAPYLTEPLEINTFQTEGRGHSDVTITVHPNGDINRTTNTTEA